MNNTVFSLLHLAVEMARILGAAWNDFVDGEALSPAQQVQLIRRYLFVQGARVANGNDIKAVITARDRFPLFVTEMKEGTLVQRILYADGYEWKLSGSFSKHDVVPPNTYDCVLWGRALRVEDWDRFGTNDGPHFIRKARLDAFRQLLDSPTVPGEPIAVKRPITETDPQFQPNGIVGLGQGF